MEERESSGVGRAKGAERASFRLHRERPRPRRPKTRQAVGIANFLCHSTANRAYSLAGLPLAWASLMAAWSSGRVISRSPLARGRRGKKPAVGGGEAANLNRGPSDLAGAPRGKAWWGPGPKEKL